MLDVRALCEIHKNLKATFFPPRHEHVRATRCRKHGHREPELMHAIRCHMEIGSALVEEFITTGESEDRT